MPDGTQTVICAKDVGEFMLPGEICGKFMKVSDARRAVRGEAGLKADQRCGNDASAALQRTSTPEFKEHTKERRMTECPLSLMARRDLKQTLPCVPILTNYSVIGALTLTYEYY